VVVGGAGVPGGLPFEHHAKDLHAVEIGDETIVVSRFERERSQLRMLFGLHVEGNSDVACRVAAVHGVLHVDVNERLIPGGPLEADAADATHPAGIVELRSPAPCVIDRARGHHHALRRILRHQRLQIARPAPCTGHARVAAVGGVPDVSRVGSHSQHSAAVNLPAVLEPVVDVKLRRRNRGIETRLPELVHHDVRAYGEVLVDQAIPLADPFDIARVRTRPFAVAPPRRLADDGAVNLVGAGHVAIDRGARREGPVVEEPLVDVVGHLDAEVLVGHEAVHQIVRIGLADDVDAIDRGRFEAPLDVPWHEQERTGRLAATHGVEVAGHPVVAQQHRRIAAARVIDHQHVVNHRGDVHILLDLMVGRGRAQVATGQAKQGVPRIEVSRLDLHAAVGVEHVVVFLLAAQVLGVEPVVRPFDEDEHPPVEPVDVGVHPPAVRRQSAHVADRVAAELVAQIVRMVGPQAATGGAVAEPRVIPDRPKDQRLKALDVGVGEEGVIQLRRTVFVLEQHTKRVLGHACAPAVLAAVNAQADVDLKILPFNRIDPFDRSRSLPVDTMPRQVRVDAALAKEVVLADHHAHGGNALEIVLDRRRVRRVLDYLRIHLVVDAGRTPRRGEARRVRRLIDDIVEKDVAARHDLRRSPSLLERHDAKTRGPQDEDRLGVDTAARNVAHLRERLAAVTSVVDHRAGCIAGDRHLERRAVEPSLMRDPGRGDETFIDYHVRQSWRRIPHQAEISRAVGVAAERYVGRLRTVGDVVELCAAVGAEQRDFIAGGAEPKAGVKPCVPCVAVGPDQKVALRGDGRARGDPPAHRVLDVIRKIHPTDIGRHIGGVVQLDPVVVLALRVLGTPAVGSQQFVDNDRGLGLHRAGRCQHQRQHKRLQVADHIAFRL